MFGNPYLGSAIANMLYGEHARAQQAVWNQQHIAATAQEAAYQQAVHAARSAADAQPTIDGECVEIGEQRLIGRDEH